MATVALARVASSRLLPRLRPKPRKEGRKESREEEIASEVLQYQKIRVCACTTTRSWCALGVSDDRFNSIDHPKDKCEGVRVEG